MISKVNLYIDELLLQNNCVVIPSFGGFIANYIPAQYNVATSLYYPPSKQILFNKNLVSNDGLLCRFIAEKENISFAEATAKVENVVFAVKQSLQSGFHVELANLGFLYLDAENSVQFKRTNNENFLIEAFGLPSVSIQAKAEVKAKSEIKFVDRPAVPSEKKQKTTSVKKYWPAFVFIPLAIGIVLFQNKTNFLGKLNVNVASWNPFTSDKPVADTVYFAYKSFPKNFPKTFGAKPELPVVVTTDSVSVIEQPTEVAVKEVAEIKTENRFYIVAGCFKSQSNANKMIKKLKRNNYNATIIGKNESGLYRVAISSFPTKEAADSALLNVKDNVETAWILSL
ncbi:MAG: SPOR domain-containing protein [Bacteroidota bacterium]